MYESEFIEMANSKGLVEVLRAQGYWGYEWSLFDIWIEEKTGEYYWYEDAGCSCYGPYENVDDINEFEHGRGAQAVAAYHSYRESYDHLPMTIDLTQRNVVVGI